MASSKDYLQFILEQLSDLEEITYRAMMGEYILYYRGKIVGGIYDDRLLVKPIKSAVSYMPEAAYELPYEGAKEMLFVDNVDDKEFLAGLFRAMYDELPAPKKKSRWLFLNLLTRIYITVYTNNRRKGLIIMMTAKVFKNGRSQAVRLPKECRFDTDEVAVNRIGDVVLLMPKTDKWDSFMQAIDMFSDDFMEDGRSDWVEQEREEL